MFKIVVKMAREINFEVFGRNRRWNGRAGWGMSCVRGMDVCAWDWCVGGGGAILKKSLYRCSTRFIYFFYL